MLPFAFAYDWSQKETKSGFRLMTTCRSKISHDNRLVPILKSLVNARIFSADRLLEIPIDKWVIRERLVSWKNDDKTFSG